MSDTKVNVMWCMALGCDKSVCMFVLFIMYCVVKVYEMRNLLIL